MRLLAGLLWARSGLTRWGDKRTSLTVFALSGSREP